MPWDDDEDEELADDDEVGDVESVALKLGHWIEERYDGDERIASIDILEPGPLDHEALRVRLLLNNENYFFVSILEDDSVVRVGFATEDEDLSKEIEEAATSQAGSLTDFLQSAIESDDELEYECSHFHDDVFYFSSDIPYQRESDLNSRHTRETILLYLEGYIAAVLGLIEEAATDDEDDED